MSQVTTPTEPGWLPDPSGRYEWRYWDGGWTNRVANTAPDEAAPAPVTPVAPSPVAAASVAQITQVLSARDAVPRVPFGTDPEPSPGTVAPAPAKHRRAPWV